MRIFGLLGLILLCGFIPIGGGNFVIAPPTPVSMTFAPPTPSIADNFLVNQQVASINVNTSNGSQFAGTVDFSPPTSSFCAQNGNAGGLFSEQQSPPYLVTAKN